MSPRGLGKGLSALIPSASAPMAVSGDTRALVVPPERIHPNPRQPRREFPAEELAGLADSLRTHGVLQPLVVTRRTDGAYELIAGERRLRAAKLAGLATVPVIVRDTPPDDRGKLELALIENVQRLDLNPVDRAMAYRELTDEFGLTQEEAAQRVGVSRSAVAHALRLLDLPPDMQAALRSGKLTEGHAKLLVGMTDAGEQRAWFQRIIENKMPVAAVAEGAKGAARKRHPVIRRGGSLGSDPNLHAKQLALQRVLGAKVTITPNASGGGVIAIAYSDAEELEGIVEAISH